MGLAPLFPSPGLSIELLAVRIDEVRVPQRRRPGFAVVDRRLDAIERAYLLETADDLWGLLPETLPDPFTTLDLAAQLDRMMGFAQQVAYCLRTTGAAVVVGKRGNRIRYSARIGENSRSGSSEALGFSDNPH